MKAITLRDVPAAIADKIVQEAKRNGASLNKTVIELLSHAVNAVQDKHPLYHDLDHLAGSWSTEEADAMNTALDQHRTIHIKL